MSYFNYKEKKIFYDEVGNGEPILLLHGNTASSKMFTPIIPILSQKYRVIYLDFLGCGNSDRFEKWPVDLWFSWSEQAYTLCKYLDLEKVNIIGCSGGALAAINLALEHPDIVNKVIADSFEGIKADKSLTKQISVGRNYAKQNEEFCSMLKMMHGDNWEQVLDADTESVVNHAKQIEEFFHHPISKLNRKILLTGSKEDEMFPEGHYEKLFKNICNETPYASSYVLEHGGHPALISNAKDLLKLCDDFLFKK